MPKLPSPPSPAELAAIRADYRTLRTGTTVARVYARGGRNPVAWNEFRSVAPLPGSRFDHHIPGEDRGVLYGARALATAVAEVFQGSRVVDRGRADPCLTAFRITRPVRLLDLTGGWPTRAGTSQAISSGPRPRAQAWSRAIHAAYPKAQGLWYPSSMHGGHPALVLFERASDGVPPSPDLDLPLSHPGLLSDLVRIANTLGYLLR